MRILSSNGDSIATGHAGRHRGILILLVAAVFAMACPPARAQEAALVIDAETGSILYAFQEDTEFYPASLTKMMTLYMAFDALRAGRLQPGQKLRVSRKASRQPRSRLGLRQGRTISVQDAVLGLITKSANDAAVVLAESLAGSEADFARAMTVKARELGMAHTVFRNASGLHHPAQMTTARDMGKLAMALLRDHPEQYRKFATRQFAWRGRRYQNHNPLLGSYEGADGIKTGYIRQAGFNLVGSAVRNGRRIIAVVLGGSSSGNRDWAMTTMLDYGFARLEDKARPETAMNLPYIVNIDDEQAVQLAVRTVAEPALLAEAPAPARARPPQRMPRLQLAEAAVAGSWAVQVGAFPNSVPAKEAALSAKAKAPELLGEAMLAIPTVTRGGNRFYRARLVGLTETSARTACRRLAAQDIPCLAIGDDGAFKTSFIQ